VGSRLITRLAFQGTGICDVETSGLDQALRTNEDQVTNAPDNTRASLPRELFNEVGDVFDAELEALTVAFEQLENDARKSYRDTNAEFIATHASKRILIVAGPGSGKSFLFLLRIRYWLQLDGEAAIYVSSFVRKLVKDLQSDVTQKLDEADANRVTVSTLHGLARSILERSHGSSDHRRRTNINIVSEEWMKVVWSDVQAFHVGLANTYSNSKFVRMFNVEEFDPTGEWPGLLATYESLSRFYNSVGFADMIVLARKAIEERPALNLHSHWIIDEFQDFNAAEDHLIRSLTYSSNGVLMAGDDEQALYQSLKQSLPEIIISYYEGDDYANAMLPFCSRCSYWVCMAASAFIAARRPEDSIRKIFLPLQVDFDKPKVQMVATPTPMSEVDYIQTFVSQHQSDLDSHIGKMEAGEETDPFLLILTPDKKLELLRTGGAGDVLRDWLKQWSVISNGKSSNYRLTLAYCAATGINADNYMLRRVLHYEGLTIDQVHLLLETAIQNECSLAEVESEFITKALAKCADISFIVDRSDLDWTAKVQLIGQIIQLSDAVRLVAELETTPIAGGIIAVEDEADEVIETAGSSSAVELLTLVGSKGLSARHVIVIGCDDVNFKYTSRLAFFVAITRARESLHLITSLQSKGSQVPHPFLKDIPDENCEFKFYKKTGHLLTVAINRDVWERQITRWVPRSR
jgi:superfamily I DNA/RNA helicase